MIVIGYQGIGKSSAAGMDNFIDLESGNFWVDGKRAADWYKPYCHIALHLHRQGYVVCTSSHEVVRNYLHEIVSDEDKASIFVCYPAMHLKEHWLYKLRTRYEHTKLDKDFKAWKGAEACFEQNIYDLANSGFNCIELTDEDYVLSDEIEKVAE